MPTRIPERRRRHCFAPAIYPLKALPFNSTEFFRSLFSRTLPSNFVSFTVGRQRRWST